MTLKEFRKYLQALVDEKGVRGLARETGVDPSTISRVLSGDEIPSDYFLDKFGFKRRITIVRK
jgi:transcriptional regulator with XRE-family HTH domain